MIKKVTNIPVYKNIQSGTKEKIEYVSEDGIIFTNQSACVAHEELINIRNEGAKLFRPKIINSGPLNESAQLIFGADTMSNVIMCKINIPNPILMDKFIGYLRAIGYRGLYHNFFNKFSENEEIIIAYWVESENSDYPSERIEVLSLKGAKEKINIFINEIKAII